MSVEYDKIEKKMKFWRLGAMSLNETGYIEYHQKLAEEAISTLKAHGWIIRAKWVEGDGWFDGMKVMWLIVEKYFPREGLILKKLSWNDSHRKGSFYVHNSGSWHFKYDGSYSELKK